MSQIASNKRTQLQAGGRPDWSALRETIDLAAVATRELGPAPGRRGEGGGRLWWNCPFHEDQNPSFAVWPREQAWHCFGCGEHGDAVDLVRRLHPELTFPETVAYLADGLVPMARRSKPFTTPLRGGEVLHAPSGLPEADALAVVQDAERRLWASEGADALAYLRTERHLTDETIRTARLGWTPGVAFPTRSGGTARAAGIVIPWLDGGRPVLVKVRQADRQPRYAEVFRDPARMVCYPHPSAIRPGLPLIFVEGEFDDLLLGQELAGLASVVTLGSASSKPTNRALAAFLRCPQWYAAHDSDPAGDKAAGAWPARARRVRPPGAFKDWTEAVQSPHPVNLRRWWRDVFAGNISPPLYVWDELMAWRWGSAVGDPTPGIVVDRPDRVRRLAALQHLLDHPDDETLQERLAIQAEGMG